MGGAGRSGAAGGGDRGEEEGRNRGSRRWTRIGGKGVNAETRRRRERREEGRRVNAKTLKRGRQEPRMAQMDADWGKGVNAETQRRRGRRGEGRRVSAKTPRGQEAKKNKAGTGITQICGARQITQMQAGSRVCGIGLARASAESAFTGCVAFRFSLRLCASASLRKDSTVWKSAQSAWGLNLRNLRLPAVGLGFAAGLGYVGTKCREGGGLTAVPWVK